MTVPGSGWGRRKEAVKIFAEERKAGAAPCASQEFPLLVGTPWEAWRPGPPAPEKVGAPVETLPDLRYPKQK